MVQATAPPPVLPDSLPRGVLVRHAIAEFSNDWIIPEEPVPESAWHDRCLEIFKALLDEWVVSSGRNAVVFRDIAIRTRRENPRVGWNPDVCLVEPAPAGATDLESMRLWDHSSPRLAFEAVSPSHPFKDYVTIPAKCAVAGVEELCVFDPLLGGGPAYGGPRLLQLWRRASDGGFDLVHASETPARSAVLDAWLIPDSASRTLRIAAQPNGSDPWPTAAERAKLGQKLALEREEAALEREAEALRRVTELEAELKRRG